MNKSLHFCMVTTFYPPYNFGGDGIYIYRLSNELARRGHRVDVVHCEDAYMLLQPNGAKGDYPNHPNVRIHRLKSRAGFLSPLLTQQMGAPVLKRNKLKRLLDENNYDVIHYHNMSLIGITALQYGHAVKLYTTHEHWLVCPMHVLWRFNREVCTKRTCFRCMVVGKRPPQLWRYTGLMERMLRSVDAFISPSRFTKARHLEAGLNIPITHIPYFLPQSKDGIRAATTKKSKSAGRPYFLFVGRLEKIKGVQNVIPVFKKRHGFDLLIAGDGNYAEALKNLAGNAPNIKFLGRLSHDRLRELYLGAVALIVPSICYEVFGIIIIESFAMRTPVIVHNLGALPEVVQESGGGFVYNNERELVSAMEKLAKDPDLRNELGNKGYQAYLKYWTEDPHLEQYFRLISDIQNQRKSVSDNMPQRVTANHLSL
jgi:glycosyltransferase involved in cell wall biosynthesis